MGDEMAVVAAELGNHASKLGTLADHLQRLAYDAMSVSMSTDAYGLICAPIAQALQPMQDRGSAALASSSLAMERTAQTVRDAAREYLEVEQQNVSNLAEADTGP